MVKKKVSKQSFSKKKMEVDARRAWKIVQRTLREGERKAKKYIDKHPARAAAIVAAAGVAAGIGLRALRKKRY